MKNTFRPQTNNRFFRPAWHLVLAGFFVASPLLGADFGDAPDGTDTFYPVDPGQPAIVGQFPTLLASNGARHTNLSDCWLGDFDSAPSSEADAVDGADPDGQPNLVNNDANDDGLPAIPFYLDLNSVVPTATITVRVTVPAGALATTRRLNVLIDWDQSGDWQNLGGGAAPEWAVMNHPVNVAPGTTELISIPIQWGLGAEIYPQIFWTRVTLSRGTINPASYPNGWDGSGSFTYGETEDYLFHPNLRHDALNSPWSAPSGAIPGVIPGTNLSAISLSPASQSVVHGTPASLVVSLASGDAPDSLEWAIDPAQRGSTSFDAGLAQQSFGGSYSVSGSTATATPGGTLPTLGSISVTSVVDPSTPAYEEWPIRVRARWDGVGTQTKKSVVRIWHSGWSGAWAITVHFDFLEQDITATVPAGQQTTALELLAAARSNYVGMELDPSIQDLGDLDAELAALADLGHITPSEETRLRSLTTDIENEIFNLDPFGVVIPILTNPVDGDTLTGTVSLAGTTQSPWDFGAVFSYSLDGITWVEIGDGVKSSGVYTTAFDTTAVPDGIIRIKVQMFDFDIEISGEYEAVVWVDNNAPAPTPVTPVPGSTIVGIIPIQVDANPNEDSTTTLELSRDGTNWYSIGMDPDAADGHSTQLDSGQLPAGTYTARATVADAYGNSTQDS
jgi:hypothetical protein